MTSYSYYDFAEDDYKTVKRLIRDMQDHNETPYKYNVLISTKSY